MLMAAAVLETKFPAIPTFTYGEGLGFVSPLQAGPGSPEATLGPPALTRNMSVVQPTAKNALLLETKLGKRLGRASVAAAKGLVL